MKFLLTRQLEEVTRAQVIFTAADALDKHHAQKCKTHTTALLSSGRGLATMFGLGALKGSVGSSSSNGSAMSGAFPLIRILLTTWLGGAGASQAATHSPNAADVEL